MWNLLGVKLKSTKPMKNINYFEHFKIWIGFVFFRLQDYNVETAIAIINDGGATLQVDTQHLKINFRISSIYQFIGELHIDSPDEVWNFSYISVVKCMFTQELAEHKWAVGFYSLLVQLCTITWGPPTLSMIP